MWRNTGILQEFVFFYLGNIFGNIFYLVPFYLSAFLFVKFFKSESARKIDIQERMGRFRRHYSTNNALVRMLSEVNLSQEGVSEREREREMCVCAWEDNTCKTGR